MNTRIQTLLAKFKETESTRRGAKVLVGHDEIEKFAQLIVQECAVIAELKEQGSAEYDKDISVGWYMQQHFGVKE